MPKKNVEPTRKSMRNKKPEPEPESEPESESESESEPEPESKMPEFKTSYTVDQILKIVKKWTTPKAIKQLNEKVGRMTKKSRLVESHEVASSKDGMIYFFFGGSRLVSMIGKSSLNVLSFSSIYL